MKLGAGLLCFSLMGISVAAQTSSHRGASSVTGTKEPAPSISALEERVSALEKKVAALESSVSFNSFLVSQKQEKHPSIQLDPSAHTFQMLDGDDSTFLISVRNVTPYLNGYRVTLSVGNPEDATFSNVTFNIRWAKAYDYSHYTADSYQKWQKSVNEKEITLNTNLLPGSWNTVNIDLVPCAADETGFMELSMKTPSIILQTDQEPQSAP